MEPGSKTANRVKQLIDDYPEDATGSDEESFWTAPKHFPSPLQFSVDDPSHFNFVMAASVLRAETFGIPIPDWIKSPTEMADAVNSVIVPEFQPDVEGIFKDDDVAIRELIMKLNECKIQLPPGFKLNPIQFEKVSFLSSLLFSHPYSFPLPSWKCLECAHL